MVKNPPVIPKAWVQSLCWKDSLETGMATHSVSKDRGAWRATAHRGHRELGVTE